MRERVDSVLSKIADLMDKASTRSSTDAQGTEKFSFEVILIFKVILIFEVIISHLGFCILLGTSYLLRSKEFRARKNFVLEDNIDDECNK